MLRFEDWKSESCCIEIEDSTNNGHQKRKVWPSAGAVLRSIRRRLESVSKKMKNLNRASSVLSLSDRPRRTFIDPQGLFLQKWNKIFVLTCVMAVSVDPLFFYIPVIKEDKQCLDFDRALQITACVLRTFFDLFYILRIIFQFKTGFIAPSSRVFGRGELIHNPVAIMTRYLTSYFIIDILSIIPLPQVIALAKKSNLVIAKDLLKYTVLIQYVPRVWRFYPLFKEVTRSYSILTQKAWAGATYNLFLFMLASHVVGAIWYMLSVESEVRCWRRELNNASLFHEKYLSCGLRDQNVFPLLNKTCSSVNPDKTTDANTFNFGIYLDALDSGVVRSTTDYPQKFFYCFWWGLRNLSSLGQNLQTSTYVTEIAFAIFIAIIGLVLFSLFIGNMQKYLQYMQSSSFKEEELRAKRLDAEQWMSQRMLPDELKERIRKYEQCQWQANRGVEEEALLRNLPRDLRRDLKRHLCLALVRRVPMFESMDERMLDAMCDILKPVLYTEKSYIVREGEPIDEMLFIMRGRVRCVINNGRKNGFMNSMFLMAGDFCGEDLLIWALDPHSSSIVPISTMTVQTISEVEAYAFMADDLKLVFSKFRPLLKTRQFQHTFRRYSPKWRAWAACFIQAAWRRYWKKKMERSLWEAEDRLQYVLANENESTLALGPTIYAARFAVKVRQTLRETDRHKQQKLLPRFPQKPPEPDFTDL